MDDVVGKITGDEGVEIVPIDCAANLVAHVRGGRVVRLTISPDDLNVDQTDLEHFDPKPSSAAVKAVQKALQNRQLPKIEVDL
jgi:anthranilate phosphoribosyltransferase